MPFINKVTVRGKTYNLENLTDGTHVVKLPTLSGDDVFVTEKTLSQGLKASSLTDGTWTVRLPSLTQNDTFVVQSKQNAINMSKVDKITGKGLSTNDYTNEDKNKLSTLENYTLPVASTNTLGGVKAIQKTEDMTQEIGADSDGRLYTKSPQGYIDEALANFHSYNIEVVDELPELGEAYTFYLIPKASGNGYEKYWWITDNDGNQKWDEFKGSSTLIVTELPQTGEEETDYILHSDAGCFYYKWIDNSWKMIAGTMANVVESLPESGNEFTDYYVKNSDGLYVHYRYIDGAFCIIGGDNYTKSQMDNKLAEVKTSIDTNAQNISSNTTNISSLSRTVDGIRQDLNNLDTEGYTYYATYGNATLATGDEAENVFTLYEVKDEKEEVKSQFVITGGGGGSTVTTTLKVERITESPVIVTTTDKVEISFNYSSVDSDGEAVDGTYTWKSGSTILSTGALVQGVNIFDMTDYVNIGTQKFILTVVDAAGTTAVKSWTVQKVDVRLESSFNDKIAYEAGKSINFTYTPYGAISKTAHFILDGVEIGTVTTSASGTLQSYTLPAQTHGAHLLECYITATINSKNIETEHIFKDVIWYDEAAETPVIGCVYRNDYYGTVTARQYDTTAIVYNVFDPTTNYSTVMRYVDEELVGTDTISTSQNVWNFKSDTVGEHTLKIVVKNITVTIIVNVTELGIDVSPIAGNLEIDFNPTGTTNSSTDRIWSNDKYAMSVSDNFDWANGGYKTDENGDTYFLVKAGTKVSFDYLMFSGGLTSNPSVLGSEMKIVFMTENVQDANAVWFSNVETTTNEVDGVAQTTNVGIQMGVHEGWLKTNNASDTDIEGDENTESVAATNTYLYMPYSEEDIIEMDINIDTLDRDDPTAKSFVMAYEDGVPSKAYVYDSGDRFYQYNPQPIVIGSDYCDVRIYRLKIYSSSLSTENIMRNFIADSRDSTTMLARYDRNSIYYNKETNTYTPYSGEGVLDPEKLAPIVPNVKILMLETDHFTTSKKVFVKSKLRCIHASGGKVYEGDPYYDNWLFENGWHSGQGTTSDNYGNSGRNVDFLFNCDGIHKPSDKVSSEADYVSQVTLGYGTENATTKRVTDWKGDDGKVGLTRTSVPNNFFNLKVNVASSENVNNALLQKRYNDFLPYISPAKKRDSKIKNDMEFVPAILFLKETNPDTSTHNEFLDTEWHFYALGNIGDSKKTDYTRAYDPEDMNEFTIEISDNTKNNATFQTGVYIDSNGERKIEGFTIIESEEDGETIYTPVSTDKPQSFVYPITLAEWENERNMRHWCMYNEDFDGDHSFEPRYACCGDYRDGKLVNDTSGRGKAQIKLNNDVWRAFYRWVITSTDEEFINELDEWCVRSAVEFFYAFTHIYTMMDNRAKNTFWHFAKTGTYRQVNKPVKELLHIYCELVDGEYITTSDSSIVLGKTYYTQYAFDLWNYDNDTALGINNNGELIFPYGKEDKDYNIDGNPSSGYVFNGATSVFWCRLRDLLPNEITSTFTSAASECFSATNLINQFDQCQECYPEEIWRLDIQRKYIRTFTGESVDNSKPKHDVQYLRDMMQGRKKYQRRQWMRDQEIYFGTMNLMNTVVGDDNRITFRCFTPTGDDIVVAPNYTLNITPYSDMYLSVMFGNGGVQQVRAKGGIEYTIECPLSTMDDTQVTIYGANRIQALSDLSACYIAANNFSMATKLRKLVLGNTAEGYNNSRLTSLTLGNNKLLEELDIRNCGSLTGSINLAQCNNLLKLYAEGTKLTGVIFATNGKVQVAHLPSTVNTLTMRNLNDLVDFDATLSRLETLTLQGGNLSSLDIVSECIDILQVLYLYDIDWTVSSTVLLNKIYNLFYSSITGKVHIAGQARQRELDAYAAAWPDLAVTYNGIITQYKVTFMNSDGTAIKDKKGNDYVQYVDQGGKIADPVASGEIDTPTIVSTAQYDYTFSGWDGISENVLNDRIVTAKYSQSVRTYTVRWLKQSGVVLKTLNDVEYGSCVGYEGDYPTMAENEDAYIYNIFAGWDKSTGFITGDTDVYAKWTPQNGLPEAGTDLKDMTPVQIYAIAAAGKANDYFEQKDHIDVRLGQDFSFSNVEEHMLGDEVTLDGTTASVVDSGVKLFGAESKSFTMAIDFEFGENSTDATLLSCFEYDGSEGFRLKYNGTDPVIQWGNEEQKVGKGNQRDLVVLRYRQGENKLYVYSFNSGASSSETYADEISYTELPRNRSTTTEATIVLGGFKFLSNGTIDDMGKGYIHWAKVWMEDLGDDIARDLASWPHETLRFEYCGNDRYRFANDSSRKTGASFICQNLLTYTHNMNSTNTNVGGWDVSNMRQFCNNRVYNAFPIEWKSIIKQVQIPATTGNTSTEIVRSNDYVYIPSFVEVFNSSEEPYKSEGSVISMFGSDADRIKTRDGVSSVWYLRSADKGFSTYFKNVSAQGSAGGYVLSSRALGICPCISV